MSTWRLITSDAVGAADGLACDEGLMHPYARHREASAAATMRLYTYAPHAALIGRYQHLEAEIDLEACRRLGVAVGRRPTGGGAILMGPGQLGVAITTRAPRDISPRELLHQFAGGIITGLESRGVRATFRGKNDLQVDGRKIAGLGLYVDDDGALLFHASVLADLDIRLMLEVLRIPGAKLADKGIERVQERITTVSRESGVPCAGADVRTAISEGFERTLGIRLVRSQPDAAERAACADSLRSRHHDARWLAGRSEGGGTRGTAALKTPAGLVRVYVGVQDGVISSVMVAGDFTVMAPSLLELEAALRWCRADPLRIADVVSAHIAGDELGAGPEALAATIWFAAERALARDASAAPVRPSGSCYFPDGEPAVAQLVGEEVMR
ncbi:MAG TPA: biotin/lipoate A/B protein ligase family protein [Solirubrobacteraceae bacterium]|nr:biotin/lipoate A/B protein ligase family protein [Solirubrobacteraceae bacterium]